MVIILLDLALPIILTLVVFRAMEASMNDTNFWTGKPNKKK